MKDFTKKMTVSLNQMQLPSLDKYLCTKYAGVDMAYTSTDIYKCKICNKFVGRNQQSLSAHQRACAKKVEAANKKPSIVIHTS